MSSAARPFSQPVIDNLKMKGIEITNIVLHTGVSSLEGDSPVLEDQAMYPDPFEVSPETAKAVNDAKGEGRRGYSGGYYCGESA